MSKTVKEMLITEVRNRIGNNTDLLVIDSSRVDAITDNRFRIALRENEISVLTVKNSLAKRALSASGLEALNPVLDGGPSSIVWGCDDVVALSKEIARWTKEIAELEIKGGVTEGTTLTAADVDSLSKSPGREELIGRIVMLIQSPGATLAGALLGPGGKLAGQIKAIVEKEED